MPLETWKRFELHTIVSQDKTLSQLMKKIEQPRMMMMFFISSATCLSRTSSMSQMAYNQAQSLLESVLKKIGLKKHVNRFKRAQPLMQLQKLSSIFLQSSVTKSSRWKEKRKDLDFFRAGLQKNWQMSFKKMQRLALENLASLNQLRKKFLNLFHRKKRLLKQAYRKWQQASSFRKLTSSKRKSVTLIGKPRINVVATTMFL